MSSLWEQRAARNEALFREVNQNIARLEERHGTTVATPVYICECATADCTAQLPIDPETYRRVRENARLFFLLPGHQDPKVERIVEEHRDFLIVQKTGLAGDVAERAER